MIPIDRQNLIIRSILTVVVVGAIFASVYAGGIHGLYASTQDTSSIEDYGFDSSTALTEGVIQNHIVTTSSQGTYSYSISHQTSIGTTTTEVKSEQIYVSNAEKRAYRTQRESSRTSDSQIEITENEDVVQVVENDQTTTYDKGEGQEDYIEYTVLENQLQQQADIFAPFAQVDWAVTNVSDNTVTYSVSNADPRRISGISSISYVGGKIVVNKETGQYESLQLQIGGSSSESPGDTAVYSYTLDFAHNSDVTDNIPPVN